LADIPVGVPVEAAASFTIPVPSITLTPASGVPGTVITITGSGFGSNIAGAVGFDSNGNGAIDPGEPQVSVATTAAGAITAGTILTVPAVPAGVYQVLADIPVGMPVEASANFTVLVRAITLSPVSGAPGTVITITGSGFAPNTAGAVGFDSDGSGALDPGEPRVSVTTTAAGAIPAGITLAVPAVAPGTYPVVADIPSGGSVEASANFTVLVRAIALSPVSGTSGTVITITGSGFAPNTVGAVGFDSNGNGAIELVEPRVSVTTTDAGFIPTGVTLTVPAIAAGVYQVLADIPSGGSVEAAASFTVVLPPSPGVLLGSARGDIILAPGVSVDIITPSTLPFMGTIGIQSTGLRYNVDVWNVTIWTTVVAAGARYASYPVSGFGLRINNDTTTTMTISYVVVYMSN
ncbi:MAG: IPT/TIG domain-containing protein, partial [Dehalococcoidia bacterium]